MQLDERYSAWKGDTFAGIREVKNWCMERIKMRQFIKQQRAIIGQDIKLAYLENANQIVETVFQEGLKMLMYIGGVFFIINGSLTIGELFAFVIYSDYVISPLFSILDIPYIFAGIIPSAKRYFEFLERESEITAGKKVHIKEKKVNGEIRFCNVDFGYSKEKTLLKNINFTIKPGEKIGIIGENGSGKSTIVNLIMRFLEPDSGYILLDGININQIDLSEYRSFMAIVSQEIYLFHCSIRENIMLSSRESEERFKSVVEKCGINKFVCKLSKQYESSVGERGSRFSGGERQKIAMARAMMRDAKILILDEATANYDVKSEQEINEVISKDYNDKTIIIITHKPEILKKMNKIVVMDHGKIADIGKYKELYGRNMFCRKMVENYIHK